MIGSNVAGVDASMWQTTRYYKIKIFNHKELCTLPDEAAGAGLQRRPVTSADSIDAGYLSARLQ
jgi:hypothetical protein